jgi:hypothetical protein
MDSKPNASTSLPSWRSLASILALIWTASVCADLMGVVLLIALITASYLTSPPVKNDISDEFWIIAYPVRLFDHGPGAFKRVN